MDLGVSKVSFAEQQKSEIVLGLIQVAVDLNCSLQMGFGLPQVSFGGKYPA